MARYWRLVNLLTESGALSLSEVAIYDGTTKIVTTASSTVAPVSGALTLLDDGLADVAVSWARCSDPGFAVVLDAGVSYSGVALRLGSGASAADYPLDLTLQTSNDLLNWSTQGSYVHATWPGAFLLTPAVGGGGAGDPYWDNVVLAMHMDGANGSTVFTDQKGNTVTRTGTAQISTAQSKFGGASAIFDGSSANKLTSAATSDFKIGGAPFTIEFWCYPTAANPNGGVLLGVGTSSTAFNSTDGRHYSISYDSNSISFQFWNGSTSTWVGTAGNSFPLNTWGHFAATYDGTTVRLFANGILQTTTNVNVVAPSSTPSLEIGSIPTMTAGSTYAYTGYIDELRITKGVARYTADFTPPVVTFPNGPAMISGTTKDSPAPQLYVPTIALTGGAVQLGLGGQTFVDVYNGGLGTITGTVKEKNTPANTPLRRRVLLIDEASRMTIRETWSDPETGAFEFRGIKQGVKYSTISYDHLHNYRAVIADNQDAS